MEGSEYSQPDTLHPPSTIVKASRNPYEKQREDRIKRNNEVLIQLGILTAASALREALPNSEKQKHAAKTMKRLEKSASELAVDIEPARRSTRLRGEAPAVHCIDSKETCRKAFCLRPDTVPTSDTQPSNNLDEHNLYRIRTMSESALQRRIYTIQRCDKLQSYVETLRTYGLDELAAEAQQRLREQFGL